MEYNTFKYPNGVVLRIQSSEAFTDALIRRDPLIIDVLVKAERLDASLVKKKKRIRLQPEEIEEMKRLREQGHTLKEIARMFGVSASAVHSHTRITSTPA
jgi:DNA-binding NarL/FixJ family response regulator